MIDTGQILAVWNTRSPEKIAGLCTEDVEVLAAALSIEPRRYTGHEGVKKWITDVREQFLADTHAEEVIELDGGAIIVRGTLYIGDGGLGQTRKQSFALLCRMRGDLIRWIGTFLTEAEARMAHGRGVSSGGAG